MNGENPLFAAWTPESGGGGPYLWANDSDIYDVGWMPNNLQFLKETLSTAFVVDKVRLAVDSLKNEPEHKMANQVQGDLERHLEVVASRVKELPALLAHSSPGGSSIVPAPNT